MNDDADTPTLYMQRVKTQTEVLLPLLRHLRAELGEAEANALVYPVLRAYMKNWIAEFASTESDSPIENFYKTDERLQTMYEGDIDYEILNDDGQRFDLDVTRCRYADFFRRLGEPELGAILVCEADDHIADLSAPDVRMSRAGTLMKGGTHCPFRYRFRDTKSGA